MNYIPKKIQNMREYVPDTSSPKIKLDANESPYDTPQSVIEAINKAVNFNEINRYPDPDMKRLLSAYGKHIGVSPDRIVAGDGSDELINLIINTFLADGGKILICEPDFSMYAFYAELAGCETIVYKKKNGFDIDFSELAGEIEKENVRLVMFSNPCNPTGAIAMRKQVLELADTVNALVVCDEAYMEFAPENESVIPDTEKRNNLIVLKTVSKIGLAGLRCGFAISNKELISALKKTKSPYNLNSITQTAVAAAVECYDEISRNVEKIKTEVNRMYTAFSSFKDSLGITLRKSNANFVYIVFNEEENAGKLHTYLKSNGISVRRFGNALRITAGRPCETDALIATVNAYIAEEMK